MLLILEWRNDTLNVMATNKFNKGNSKVKLPESKMIELQSRRKLIALRGKVKWEGDLDEMRGV